MKNLNLKDSEKFEIAKTEVEREFKCEFQLAPNNKTEAQARIALFVIARVACNINVEPLRNILRDINPYTSVNEPVINSEARKAYYLQLQDDEFRKKMNTAHDQTAKLIKEHNRNGAKAIANNAWNSSDEKEPSDKAKLLLVDIMLRDRGQCLFSMGLEKIGA